MKAFLFYAVNIQEVHVQEVQDGVLYLKPKISYYIELPCIF